MPGRFDARFNHRRSRNRNYLSSRRGEPWHVDTIALFYFIAFPARVRLLHARPVLQSDFNASLIISDLTRGVPLSLFHASGANGGGCYICMSEFSFQFN